MSYGPNYLDLNRRAAELVDKILRGTKPADIPVEQPTKYQCSLLRCICRLMARRVSDRGGPKIPVLEVLRTLGWPWPDSRP
jgi:hypothetical protein